MIDIVAVWVIFIKRKLDKLFSEFMFAAMAYQWRKRNRHNKTFAARKFPITRVTVGRHSYGMLDVRTFCDEATERLEIGNYVSIAEGVVFILGGQHQTNTITSFPLKAYFTRIDNSLDSGTKGPIIIEDEVWIGMNVIILSGVRIGRGSIIGAGAVVAKSIPPFAIAVGNPAKIIKYRFSNETISKIKNIRIIDISEQRIQDNIELFYKSIDEDDSVIKSIKQLMKN